MLHSRPKILFLSTFLTPFIQDDIDTLTEHFTVKLVIGHGVRHIVNIIRQALHADVIVCWFASTYTGIAVAVGRFFGIKSIVIIGGVDVAKDPELGYGIWLNPRKARIVRYALRHADTVLAVDPSLRDDAMRLARYHGENIHYLPTGYDSMKWKPVGVKELSILTVAIVRDPQRVRVKGIDTLIDAARRMPEIPFIIVGVERDIANRLRPPDNMAFHPPMERDDLLEFYRQAKVYCQPSRREGLPNTLCEAMLCGCIPVATEVGGNVSAVGETGILVPRGNSTALASALRMALAFGEDHSLAARARIVSLFPREKRQTELVRIIEGYIR